MRPHSSEKQIIYSHTDLSIKFTHSHMQNWQRSVRQNNAIQITYTKHFFCLQSPFYRDTYTQYTAFIIDEYFLFSEDIKDKKTSLWNAYGFIEACVLRQESVLKKVCWEKIKLYTMICSFQISRALKVFRSVFSQPHWNILFNCIPLIFYVFIQSQRRLGPY